MSHIHKHYQKLSLARLIIVLLVGIGLWATLASKEPVEPMVLSSPGVITESLIDPDESVENAKSYSWQGEEYEPRLLDIPKYSVSTFVQKMGNDQSNKIAVPTNVHLAGWYQNSVHPGDDGITVIVGHVTGKESDGVFKNIALLDKGDVVSITAGNGIKFTYNVLSAISVIESEAINYIFSSQPGIKKQLSLVTCGGEFNSNTNQYDYRIIVYAEQKDD